MLFGATFSFQDIQSIYLIFVSIIVLALFLYFRNLKILILLASILVGFFYSDCHLSCSLKALVPYLDKENIYIGKILSVDNSNDRFVKKYYFKVNKIIDSNNNTREVNSEILVLGSKYEEYSPHDIVQVKGILKRPKGALLPGLFDERKYLLTKNVHYILKAEQGSLVFLDTSISSSFIKFINSTRSKLLKSNNTSLEPNNASLVNGILFGSKASRLKEELNNRIRDLGLSHITSASGFNVAILSGAIFALCGFFLKRNKIIPSIFSILFVLLYCALADCSASIVRATIFLILVIIGGLFDKKPKVLSGISFIMLLFFLVNPLNVLDIGLQLSVFAFLGLALLEQEVKQAILPSISKHFHNLISLIIQTLIAQIFVFPLLIFYFHNMQILGSLSNLLAVPLASVILITGLIKFLFLFSPFLEHLIDVLLNIFSGLFLKWVDFLYIIPYKLIYFPNISFYTIVLLYCLLFLCLCGIFINSIKRKFIWLFVGISTLAIFSYISTDTSHYLKVFFLPNYNKHSVLICPPKQNPIYLTLKINKKDIYTIKEYLKLNNLPSNLESYELLNPSKTIPSNSLIKNETNKVSIRYQNFSLDILKNYSKKITNEANHVFLPILKKNDPLLNKVFDSYPEVLIINDYKKLSKKSIQDKLFLKSLPSKTFFLSECGTVSLITDGKKHKIDCSNY